MNPVIQLKNLSKTYSYYKKAPGLWGSFKSLFYRKKLTTNAVKEVSFEIKQGEAVGFLGPNGAGKTTTLKMLSGILYPTSGEASVLGYTPWKRERAFQKHFTLIMGQKNQLWWDLPAMETFLLNKEIYEIPESEFRKNLDEMVDLLALKDLLNVQVRKLSLGERMKCELTAALLHAPKVIFMDEPTIGLDVVTQKKVWDFLKDYNKRKQATLLLTSHYMEDIREVCERVIIIDHGAKIFDGPFDHLIEKYADSKNVELHFERPVSREVLIQYGKIERLEDSVAFLSIPRKESIRVITEILNTLPVHELSVHEKEASQIVREIFDHTISPPRGRSLS